MKRLFVVLFLGSCALSPGPSGPRVSLPSYPSRTVYLTFDLCPTHEGLHLDRGIVDFLLKENIPATFFISGRWLESHMTEAELLKSPLFSIGSHGFRHLDFTTHSETDLSPELSRTSALLLSFFGRPTKLFRFPYGHENPESERFVAKSGYTAIGWLVETKDPEPGMSAALLRGKVRKEIRPGGIILMHANGYGIHTAEALPLIVADLKAKSYVFRRIPENLPSGVRR
jgi:peptidoglycan/xylan/chitin deacetylase (PgdA/CDA1 family)